ncbi:MAG TPA: HAD family phosphatase [Candidatus Woesebacteria bacterium]|nr:HAD family phosphatase [Candidatus Woesebacteria bacterium]
MIKAIIFDFGNVICRFDNDIYRAKIAEITGKKIEDIKDSIFRNSDILYKFETGLISNQDFFKELSKICGLNIPYDQLKEIYSKDKFTHIEGMTDLIKKLQKKYKIGLLSNTSSWDYDYILKEAPIIKTFDTITTSFGVKAMKPSPKIFEDALNKLKLKAEECVYTDDILEYIEAAEKLGIKAVHFTTTENFKSDLKNLGVEIE